MHTDCEWSRGTQNLIGIWNEGTDGFEDCNLGAVLIKVHRIGTNQDLRISLVILDRNELCRWRFGRSGAVLMDARGSREEGDAFFCATHLSLDGDVTA